MPNVFIHGSCVSRDTIPFLGDGWEVVAYVARQGMISAANKPGHLMHESHLTSKFQNTCLRADLASSLYEVIEEHAADTDIAVLDLVDERLGVYDLGGGAYATHSWELEESRLLRYLPELPPHHDFGSDEHFTLWVPAATETLRRFRTAGIPVLVLAPEWAETSDTGRTGIGYRQIPAARYNELYARYFDHLEAEGAAIVRVGQDVVCARETHRWGLEPFHYNDEVYEIMQAAIKAACSESRQPVTK